MSDINELLFDWNAPTQVDLSRVEIQDDSLREGLKGVCVRKPSLTEKIELLTLASQIGVQSIVLGFPGRSPAEYEECRALLRVIMDRKLAIEPRFVGMAGTEDVAALLALQRETSLTFCASLIVDASPIRRYVEDRSLHEMMVHLERVTLLMGSSGLKYGIFVEDATRMLPDELRTVIDIAINGGVSSILLCDTIGACTPEGVKSLIHFTLDAARDRGSRIDIGWHGHNDRGFALANAVSAAHAGARIIGGSFLGLGDRAGTMPLEQFIMYLHQCGVAHYRLDLLLEYCETLSRHTKTPIPDNMPLVGSQAFAIGKSTYAEAIHRSRDLGMNQDEYIFTAVPVSKLGRSLEILIAPGEDSAHDRTLDEFDTTSSDDTLDKTAESLKAI